TFPYALDVTAKVTTLRDFFITLFFVALGMTIPVPGLSVIGLALMIAAFTVVSRLVTTFVPLYLMKQGLRASLLPALNLEQITEFDFNPNVYQTLLSRGLHVIYGDISSADTLLHAGVGKSEMIILSVPDALLKGASNEKLVRHVRTLNPTAMIIATADLLADVGELYEAGASYVAVTRLSDAHELFTVIEAAQAGLRADKRAQLDQRL